MNWNQLLSTKRFGQEAYHAVRDDDRSEFQRDYDRLIFFCSISPTFKIKTQVFPASRKCICTQPAYSQPGSGLRGTVVGK